MRSVRRGRLGVLIVGAGLPLVLAGTACTLGDEHEPATRDDAGVPHSYLETIRSLVDERSAIVTDASPLAESISQQAAGAEPSVPSVGFIAPNRDVIQTHLSDGYTVYSFRAARPALGLQGFRFQPAPIVIQPSEDSNDTIGRRAFDRRDLEIFELAGAEACAQVSAGLLTDITSLAAGGRVSGALGLDSTEAPELAIYVGRPRPMKPRLAASSAPIEPVFTLERLRAGAEARAALQDELTRSDVPSSHRPREEDTLYRMTIRPSATSAPTMFRIDFGGLPRWALATVSAGSELPAPATVCASPPTEDLLFAEGRRVERIRPGHHTFFGDGWHASQRTGTPAALRWAAAPEAELMILLARADAVRVRVDARPSGPPGAPAPTLALRVNETPFSARTLRRRRSEYEWSIPAVALRAGVNQFFLQSSTLSAPASWTDSDDERRLGVGVSLVTVELLDDPT